MGMFFAGTNTHSLDFRKSAGGFIHGYRYTSQYSVFSLINENFLGLVFWRQVVL